MPASDRSIRLTDAYRQRLVALQQRARLLARWDVHVDELDASGERWLERIVAQLQVLQRAGVALSAGYLAAFISTELDRPPAPRDLPDETVGQAQDGQPLAKALAAALITVKIALKDGRPEQDALRLGEQRATRLASSAALAAPRSALHTGIANDDRIVGWRRVTFGGCGACLAAADGLTQPSDRPLKVHDHCRCTAEPVLLGVAEGHRRRTGREIFDTLSPEQQNSLLGDEKAELIRTGNVAFERLIQPQPMAIAPDGITEAPLAALRP